MGYFKEWREKRKELKQKKHAEYLKRRAEEIFTVEEYDGQMWYFCNNTGIFPCSFIKKNTEEEILQFLNEIRKFYTETE